MLPVSLLLSLSLTAAPLRLAATQMTLADVSPERGEFLEELLVQELARRPGLAVTSRQDVQRAIGVERQRQLLGCAGDESACMAELAGALGANGILSSSLAKLGSKWALRVRVVGARAGETLAVFSDSVSREEDLVGLVEKAARELAGHLVTEAPLAPASVNRTAGWVTLAAGALVAGGGAASFGLSRGVAAQFAVPGSFKSSAAVTQAVQLGQLEQTLGIVGFAVGGAALVTGVVLAVLGVGAPSVSAALAPVPGGGLFALELAWP